VPKPKEGNIYDLVERAAARRHVPRLELWELVLRALIEEELLPSNVELSDLPNRRASQIEYRDWFDDILNAVIDRGFDPASVWYLFKKIIVRRWDFESLPRKGNIGGRGPKPNETGFQKADRKLFPEITRLQKSGQARSPYGAALKLGDKLAGVGTLGSRAKRVSKLFRKEHPANR
jgi:hypothetical protein